jgi:hypothetical protein
LDLLEKCDAEPSQREYNILKLTYDEEDMLMLTYEDIRRAVTQVAATFSVKRATYFGSYAEGKYVENICRFDSRAFTRRSFDRYQ